MSVYAKKWAYDQHPRRVEDGDLTAKKHPGAKAVLVALAEHPAPNERHCWPSQKTLAEMTDLTERQVRRCLGDLEWQGLIHRQEERRANGSRRSDTITLLGPIEEFGPAKDQPDERSGRQPHQPDEQSGGGRTSGPGGADERSALETSGETSIETSVCDPPPTPPQPNDQNTHNESDSKTVELANATEQHTRPSGRPTQADYWRMFEEVVHASEVGDLLMEFGDILAARNKTREMKPSRYYNDVAEPYLAAKERLSIEALKHGLNVAIRKEARNFNYVLAVAQSYAKEQTDQRELTPTAHGERSGRGSLKEDYEWLFDKPLTSRSGRTRAAGHGPRENREEDYREEDY